MRQIRYVVAMSLDGYIAGPNGEADWIENDPEVDFGALWAQFDTGVMGRRTSEAANQEARGESAFSGMKTIVFSTSLQQKDHKGSNHRFRTRCRMDSAPASRTQVRIFGLFGGRRDYFAASCRLVMSTPLKSA